MNFKEKFVYCKLEMEIIMDKITPFGQDEV